jgi:hypothetical protein
MTFYHLGTSSVFGTRDKVFYHFIVWFVEWYESICHHFIYHSLIISNNMRMSLFH